ncbi:hypothetical protein D1AOALGA4SA_1036 [Olavius algarvensis Delta 1 endosymbiont]|nr:hypothetical protein D1AOALGA4SA_1036 [Olavius algarvensis Delta 1 endosymbiont]
MSSYFLKFGENRFRIWISIYLSVITFYFINIRQRFFAE